MSNPDPRFDPENVKDEDKEDDYKENVEDPAEQSMDFLEKEAQESNTD